MLVLVYGPLRDWSLITGRGGGGGATKREGGVCEVLHLKKGWGAVLAMLKGAHKVLG